MAAFMNLLSNLEYELLKAFFGRIFHCLSLAKMTLLKKIPLTLFLLVKKTEIGW